MAGAMNLDGKNDHRRAAQWQRSPTNFEKAEGWEAGGDRKTRRFSPRSGGAKQVIKSFLTHRAQGAS
jgi:hypothetical protein